LTGFAQMLRRFVCCDQLFQTTFSDVQMHGRVPQGRLQVKYDHQSHFGRYCMKTWSRTRQILMLQVLGATLQEFPTKKALGTLKIFDASKRVLILFTAPVMRLVVLPRCFCIFKLSSLRRPSAFVRPPSVHSDDGRPSVSDQTSG